MGSIFQRDFFSQMSFDVGHDRIQKRPLFCLEGLGAALSNRTALYGGLLASHMLTNVNVWIHMIWSTLDQGIASVSICMQWGMMDEVIDYNEYITGKRAKGSSYGIFNPIRWIGQIIGNSAAVLALGWVDYKTALVEMGPAWGCREEILRT